MSAAHASEADLTRTAMTGDERAFGQLVLRHQASVRALARRLTRSASDGDDIAQAAFLAAWRRRSTWRGGSFRAWVCAIAYREFLNARRDPPSEEAHDIASQDSQTGERMDLIQALGALNENERAAVLLCLGAGFSHAEAALTMEAPLGTVKSWVLRGRAKLQEALAAYVRA